MLFLSTEDCFPPHRVTHEERLDFLKTSIQENGWTGPILIGYPFEGKIQLLSGSHRYQAAKELGIKIPVDLFLYSRVEELFGTDDWLTIIAEPHEFNVKNEKI